MSEVLIVDDDHNFRETFRELLSDAGYQTQIATNPEEGIALLQTTTPDLTLCDWKMPGGGGEQFLKSLQSEGLLTTMPVIILTAHGTGPNAMKAMQLGAYDFITKPLDIDLALPLSHAQSATWNCSARSKPYGSSDSETALLKT